MNPITIIGLGLIAIFALVLLQSYNRLVGLRAQLERAWANIDVLLKQRYDEIPQLVKVIEQFTQFEAGAIKSVVEARAHYGQARSVSEKIQASGEMSLALKGLFALGEAYPELRSNQNFLQLQSRVSELESSLADRRETYNEAVANFNTRIEQIPDVFAANLLKYQRQDMFEVQASEKVAPSLQMNLPQWNKNS